MLILLLAIYSEIVPLPRAFEARSVIDEAVFVETPLDTDSDGKLDKIYVRVSRPLGGAGLPSILRISPYDLGGSPVRNHDVDVPALPQDRLGDLGGNQATQDDSRVLAEKYFKDIELNALERGYASVSAHSLGTGYSDGCPTVGDDAETLATKAVIDWLGGRAKAFSAEGKEVKADWSNGSVGMTGVSYNGTLPNMVATTGVEGLKAIIPVAAISSWYNYYRSNGLVVGPGGYIGEDADILGRYIVRSGRCENEMQALAKEMGREHGDFAPFWQKRDYVSRASKVKAAVFIIHGQSDWNVRQRHAIEWWNALAGVTARRMWLHNEGHSSASRPDAQDQIWAWFDHYVRGMNNGVEKMPAVEVQSPDGKWTPQKAWPHETTRRAAHYLGPDLLLSSSAPESEPPLELVDFGKAQRLEALVPRPAEKVPGRLLFLSTAFKTARLMSGTPRVSLRLSLKARSAANLTVAIIEYAQGSSPKIITRGWADPQNHGDITRGEPLTSEKQYVVSFDLEPKQYLFAKGSRLGVLVTSTDYEHTLRPDVGTEISIYPGRESFVELGLSE